MKVKICGIKTEQAANDAIRAGADFIGFVFAPSKRQVSMQRAKEISQQIPAHINKVGVFVNESSETINRIADTVGLDYAQLHGDEPPGLLANIKIPVIKAIQIADKDDLRRMEDYQCDYYLLDSPSGKYHGGNGEVFNWSLTRHLPNEVNKVILAGGLNAMNVRDAIKEVSPIGVDVSSGVETAGEKDPAKIRAFIEAAKS
ncbi:phosphoribosylanthranilate isomerase [Sediminibacillus albus]|uniref:N-(5'-phosphoribosyl)anthranilate isomerase n=1 Tax=Sediminibacillus albus TaxID=407036 RepID=A0A1G8ZVB5_9BACI|nr:phosphoribosylanthranilate isomerase [Sediminibacillus albus]SDK18305.1 phosphoribosylanthranilate isomerase [Sediminibacillus albus]